MNPPRSYPTRYPLPLTAEEAADRLRAALAKLDVAGYLVPVASDKAAVSLWHGLIAWTDGRMIWWTSPRLSRRGTPLLVLAYAPETAAVRLALDYVDIRTARRAHNQDEQPRAGEPV
ncbi:hypothetical protein [Nonomuraea rhodomycinica]|uniref:Uncharacterized protein n=1 Tax=Nonomuraea rhodomycinica TaxID=1712872 RepID=A0A7Y6MFR8_9ACTN|nr:hypothetical protein [Nonomuraea rhodomycinica]NUW47013.1 hypothetical protein [Nonomuraea rhodomycinica]